MKTRLAGALAALFLLLPALATALEIRPYTPAAFAEAQHAGKPVALHFHADWCPVCRAQQLAIGDLRKAGAAEGLLLFVASYDDEKPLRRKHRVATQSTLVVFRGVTEVSRIAGETGAGKIRAALEQAL